MEPEIVETTVEDLGVRLVTHYFVVVKSQEGHTWFSSAGGPDDARDFFKVKKAAIDYWGSAGYEIKILKAMLPEG